jgi:hypothetical protein
VALQIVARATKSDVTFMERIARQENPFGVVALDYL